MSHLDADPDTSYPVLIEYLGERLIKRSRKCNFAVENTEKEVSNLLYLVIREMLRKTSIPTIK